MPSVPVVITCYVDDDQPGWVEFVLRDEAGRDWIFREKVPIVTTESLDARSQYPAAGSLRCEVLHGGRASQAGGVVEIDTERPFGVASIDGATRFSVLAARLGA